MEIARKQKEILLQQQQNESENTGRRALDFLTNPNIQLKESTEKLEILEDQEQLEADKVWLLNQIKSSEVQRSPKLWSYSESVKQRNLIYDNTIQRIYDKRINPAFFAKLKKKTPALNITSKNKISFGRGRVDPEEHKLRVYNRENVPTMPELIIPSFMIRKDLMAKNILAYLKDYSPLYREQNHKAYPRCVQNILNGEEDMNDFK